MARSVRRVIIGHLVVNPANPAMSSVKSRGPRHLTTYQARFGPLQRFNCLGCWEEEGAVAHPFQRCLDNPAKGFILGQGGGRLDQVTYCDVAAPTYVPGQETWT